MLVTKYESRRSAAPEMVCVKTRYIVIRIRPEDDRKVSFESSLVPIIKSRLKADYGNYVLSMVGRLSVVEYLPHCQMAVIKCDVEACKYILFTMTTIGEVPGMRCSISVLWISGILKKAMKKVLKYAKVETIDQDAV